MAAKAKLSRISYFSDFFFMQQLMALEVDILLGSTVNYIKSLGGPTEKSEEYVADD